MAQGLTDGFIRVLQFGIFARDGDFNRLGRVKGFFKELKPFGVHRVFGLEVQQFQHLFVHFLLVEIQRHFVNGFGVGAFNNRLGRHAAKQRKFVFNPFGQRLFRAADEHAGLYAHFAQFVDRVLRGLGFQLLRHGNIGHQRNVYADDVFGASFQAQLARRFQKGQGLNVAHRAADFYNGYVKIFFKRAEAFFDFVGNVRNDLHRRAQIFAAAFLVNDGLVNAAGGVGVGFGHFHVQKAFVMAQIQIRFGPVYGDEHFAVLVGAHGARVHIDVRVALNHVDLKPVQLQQLADACAGNAFAQRADHAAGDDDEFGHMFLLKQMFKSGGDPETSSG